jgi:hypothetical protein
MASSPSLTAFWIWRRQDSYVPYHQVILARKTFRLAHGETPGAAPEGCLKIAVDGAYRLYVNSEWVADGPARSWPEHFQYDEIDVTPYLAAGRNELAVVARHWQVGDFHNRPQQAGLLVQLDLKRTGAPATKRRIVSDRTWETAWLTAWAADTPKVSIQMEPQELYDARLEDGMEFSPAVELYSAAQSPWSDLHRRDVALLTRRPVFLRQFLGASLVKRLSDLDFCLPAVRLAHPGAVEANHFASANAGMATLLELDAPAEVQLALEGMAAAIDGVVNPDGRYALAAGRHLLAAFAWPLFGHRKERSLRIVDPPAPSMRLVRPGSGPAGAAEPSSGAHAEQNPWVCLVLPAYAVLEDDMDWFWFSGPHHRRDDAEAGYHAAIDKLLRAAGGWDALACQGEQITTLSLPADEMFVTDTHWQFVHRLGIGSAAGLVERPGALMHDHAELTTIHPSEDAGADVELAYDLGEQTVGYFDFELLSPAGVQVDIYAVEYIRTDGVIQHTDDNHNGLRYITCAGLNSFTSLKRRAGRYLFITLRGATAPVQFRLVRVIESTYPVEQGAFFECSDARLDRIWEISARTLKLCMEDTFTDCPLYEQTGWVGDARNEALFALDTFGAADIVLRGLRLAAQSLERFPLVGGQVPSGWDMLLPAWSFLWGIGVWDYYFYTGDRSALEELWPAVLRQLQGAEKLLDESGLFSGKFWNMFDWTPVDDHHQTVLHNSLLLIGSVEAAIQAAAALGVGDASTASWLAGLRARLVEAVERTWDARKQAYPDSILEDGTPSPSTSMHTSFLALLYGVAPAARQAALLRNALTPPEGMVRVGSPFAMLYLYEALAAAGQPATIVSSIYENYLPMLAAGATTVWEVFPTSGDHPGGFPTRSHCHAWSSAPLRFLPQIVLGIHQEEAGGAAYTVSPWLGDLEWARGAVCTCRGLLEVSWTKENGRLKVSARAPAGVTLRFEENASMEGLEVRFEG